MRRSWRRALSPLCIVVAALTGASPVSAAAAGPIPESLVEFLDDKGPDGKPIVKDEQRQYLTKLPEHTRQLLGHAGDDGLGGPKQLQMLLSLKLSPQALEIVLQDRCILCHTDVDNQNPNLVLSLDPVAAGAAHFMNLKEFVSDVHFRRGLSCAGCHGGDPTARLMGAEIATRWPKADVRKKDRAWVPRFCARCHADPAFMRGFNPNLPTDQLDKYRTSKHGVLLLQKQDSHAAQCVSCHGAHGIRGPKSRQSTVFPQRVPDTCGACHADPGHMAGYKTDKGDPLPTNQLAQFKRSVHGIALQKGNLGAAACNDCHGNHASMPPAVSSIAQVCRTCHMLNGQLFDGSKHKQSFEKHDWPECEQCHGKHDIAHPTDALLSTVPGGLCHDCHQRYAKQDAAKCEAAAAHFHDTIVSLDSGGKALSEESERLAERGLDVEPLSYKITDAREAVVQSRARVHSFDRGNFNTVAEPGLQALRQGRELVAAARAEYRFRQRGLWGAIAFTCLLALGIVFKIRSLEKRGRGPR